MANILIINGPNLNMLGKRDKAIYGDISLDDIEKKCQDLAKKEQINLSFKQSNKEGEIVELIHDSLNKFDAILINAAAYTHTSVAIRDALEIFSGVKIEIHISNIFAREEFRQKSLLSDMVDGIISGFGHFGYEMAVLGTLNIIKNK